MELASSFPIVTVLRSVAASCAPFKSPNSVSTTDVVTAGVVTVLRAPVPLVSATVVPVSVPTVLRAPAPVAILSTSFIASRVA